MVHRGPLVKNGFGDTTFEKESGLRQHCLRIGSFNLNNLVLPGKPFYTCSPYSAAEYLLKLCWIRQQLRRMKADIVGFQEVFHLAALRQAVAYSEQYHQATVVLAGETGDKPRVGLLSRYPLSQLEIIEAFPEQFRLAFDDIVLPVHQFSRPLLKATVEIPDSGAMTVFVVHLKSKRPLLSPACDPQDPAALAIGKAKALTVRAAEAAAFRHILISELSGGGRPVTVLGDLNDTANAVTSEIITGAPTWRPAVSETATAVLYNAWDVQQNGHRDTDYYTHIYNGALENLDLVLVSRDFLHDYPQRRGYVSEVAVFNDHLVDDTMQPPLPRWQSDHGQVTATIVMEN